MWQVFNYLAGSLARIFTTIKEVDDPLVLYGFLAGFVLNLVLAGQMVYYWNSAATAPHGEEIGERPAKIVTGKSSGVQTTTSGTKGKGASTRRRG